MMYIDQNATLINYADPRLKPSLHLKNNSWNEKKYMMPNCKEARVPCFLIHALVTHDDSNWEAKVTYGQLAAMDEFWSCCLSVECGLWFLVPNRKQALPDSGQGLAPLPGLSSHLRMDYIYPFTSQQGCGQELALRARDSNVLVSS